MTTREKFYANTIANESGCMEWQGALGGSTGYGKVKHEGRAIDTHRASWLLSRGPIPAGMDVCHTCDNRSCVNPLHLFLGTRQQNMIDGVAKGRVSTARAVAAHRVTLTDNEVRHIDALAESGMPQETIAKLFNIARQTVSKIVLRQRPRYAALFSEEAAA